MCCFVYLCSNSNKNLLEAHAEIKRGVRKSMKVKIIPGSRNEEMIADINHALETLENDALEEYLDEKVCEGEEWFDAMYYATEERGDSILASWEEYLLERLMTDDKFYFAADVGDYDF